MASSHSYVHTLYVDCDYFHRKRCMKPLKMFKRKRYLSEEEQQTNKPNGTLVSMAKVTHSSSYSNYTYVEIGFNFTRVRFMNPLKRFRGMCCWAFPLSIWPKHMMITTIVVFAKCHRCNRRLAWFLFLLFLVFLVVVYFLHGISSVHCIMRQCLCKEISNIVAINTFTAWLDSCSPLNCSIHFFLMLHTWWKWLSIVWFCCRRTRIRSFTQVTSQPASQPASQTYDRSRTLFFHIWIWLIRLFIAFFPSSVLDLMFFFSFPIH